MKTEPDYNEIIQSCIEGTADEATQQMLIAKAKEDPSVHRLLMEAVSLDAVLYTKGFDRTLTGSD